jgi:hypothetical protein
MSYPDFHEQGYQVIKEPPVNGYQKNPVNPKILDILIQTKIL